MSSGDNCLEQFISVKMRDFQTVRQVTAHEQV